MPNSEIKKESPSQSDKLKDVMPDENWVQRLARKISPFGPAFPVWIAVFLIGLILLFTLIIRIVVDYNLLGME